MERGRSQAVAIRSRVTGSGWLARNRSTRRARVAAGTLVTEPSVAVVSDPRQELVRHPSRRTPAARCDRCMSPTAVRVHRPSATGPDRHRTGDGRRRRRRRAGRPAGGAHRRGGRGHRGVPGRRRGAGGGARRRRTASRRASAPWPPGTSRRRCAPSCSARWSARTPPAAARRSSARSSRALMLLRLSTLATGRTGIRPATAQLMADLLTPRHHPGRPRVRLARLLRRPRAAVALRAGADRRGPGPSTPTARPTDAADALAEAGLRAGRARPPRRAWR